MVYTKRRNRKAITKLLTLLSLGSPMMAVAQPVSYADDMNTDVANNVDLKKEAAKSLTGIDAGVLASMLCNATVTCDNKAPKTDVTAGNNLEAKLNEFVPRGLAWESVKNTALKLHRDFLAKPENEPRVAVVHVATKAWEVAEALVGIDKCKTLWGNNYKNSTNMSNNVAKADDDLAPGFYMLNDDGKIAHIDFAVAVMVQDFICNNNYKGGSAPTEQNFKDALKGYKTVAFDAVDNSLGGIIATEGLRKYAKHVGAPGDTSPWPKFDAIANKGVALTGLFAGVEDTAKVDNSGGKTIDVKNPRLVWMKSSTNTSTELGRVKCALKNVESLISAYEGVLSETPANFVRARIAGLKKARAYLKTIETAGGYGQVGAFMKNQFVDYKGDKIEGTVAGVVNYVVGEILALVKEKITPVLGEDKYNKCVGQADTLMEMAKNVAYAKANNAGEVADSLKQDLDSAKAELAKYSNKESSEYKAIVADVVQNQYGNKTKEDLEKAAVDAARQGIIEKAKEDKEKEDASKYSLLGSKLFDGLGMGGALMIGLGSGAAVGKTLLGGPAPASSGVKNAVVGGKGANNVSPAGSKSTKNLPTVTKN